MGTEVHLAKCDRKIVPEKTLSIGQEKVSKCLRIQAVRPVSSGGVPVMLISNFYVTGVYLQCFGVQQLRSFNPLSASFGTTLQL